MSRRKSARFIAKDVARRFKIPVDHITGNSTHKRVVKARHELWHRMERAGYSMKEISEGFGVKLSTVEESIAHRRAAPPEVAEEDGRGRVFFPERL